MSLGSRPIQHLVADEQQLIEHDPLHAKQKLPGRLAGRRKTRGSIGFRLLYRLGTRLGKLGHENPPEILIYTLLRIRPSSALTLRSIKPENPAADA
jgi:hypothetical protein